MTPKQRAENVGKLEQYKQAETQVQAARGLRPATHPPRAPPSPGSLRRRMCLRRSPPVLAARGGRQPPTQSTRSVTGARAARLVVNRCIRGSKCRAHRLRAPGPSAAQIALVQAAMCRAQRGMTGVHCMQAHQLRNAVRVRVSAYSVDGRVGVPGRAAPSSDVRGAFLRRTRRSARSRQCLHHNMSILGQVLSADVCTGAFRLKYNFNPCAANTAALSGKSFFRLLL